MTLSNAIKYITAKTVQPLVRSYLSKERTYRYKGITLQVPPQVFHPAFFFSTKYLLQFISKLNLSHKSFLELGAGSGLIAFTAAAKGAIVTATDINSIATTYLHKNSNQNNVAIAVIECNLFDNIPQQHFDIIAINPPYYKKSPVTQADYAWYCGVNNDYFSKLFSSLGSYVTESSEVYMILNNECDIQGIKSMAETNGYTMPLVESKRKLWEMNYIFKIEQRATGAVLT